MGAGGIEHLRVCLGNGANPWGSCFNRVQIVTIRFTPAACAGDDVRNFPNKIREVEMAVAVDQIRKAGHSRLPLGEGTRRLIDLEEDIHQKRGRVKIDSLAPAGVVCRHRVCASCAQRVPHGGAAQGAKGAGLLARKPRVGFDRWHQSGQAGQEKHRSG